MDEKKHSSQASQPHGGPKSPHGKGESRRNALRHGMTAKTLLPEVLGRDLVDKCYNRLRTEWKPATPTQAFFVREMARHQAALERIEQIEEAALRRSARGALNLFFDDQDEDDLSDAALAGAGTSDAIERVARYRRPHERGYLRSLTALRDLKVLSTARQEEQSQGESEEPQRRFGTEGDCESLLTARWTGAEARCPRCDGRDGSWIPSGKTWQCCACRLQSSLRAGTVMAGSRLRLVVWFRAIEAMLKNPSASTTELMNATGIRRAATVRRAARRIRQALESSDRSARLAGLDRVFGPPRLG